MSRILRWAFVVGLAVLSASPTDGQTVRLNSVMRLKLAHAQSLLGALVTSNWSELENQSRALLAVTRDPAWQVLRSPEYVRQTEAFQRAVEALVLAATQRDLEAASNAYAAVPRACVGCHMTIARSRIGRGLAGVGAGAP